MANKYILKRGVFLRQIGLTPLCEGTLRNNDELAESYLKNDPTLVKYFETVPGKTEYAPPQVTAKPVEPIVIIEPKEPEIIPPEPEKAEVGEVPTEPEKPPVKIIKAVRKQRKRAKTKK